MKRVPVPMPGTPLPLLTAWACHLAIVALVVTHGGCTTDPSRVRRSDDYDNMDNFLMGSNDYDNFFLKTAKSVPRIGRRDGAGESTDGPVHVDRRSVDMNELVPNTGGYEPFFLKASKSVPRIGKRNDEFFMKTAKSVPRIGRRSGDGPDNFLLKGRLPSDYLKAGGSPLELDSGAAVHKLDRRSRLEVEEREPLIGPAGGPGGHDALLESRHRVQRRSRLAKRMHPALNEVGDFGTDSQWPWFRQQDTSPGPYKRANPADSLNLSEVSWESLDALLRTLEGRTSEVVEEEDKHPDMILLRQPGTSGTGDKWRYGLKRDMGSKELDEPRYQPDVK